MAVRYPGPPNLFTGADYAEPPSMPHLAEVGSYEHVSVLSPHQFEQQGEGYRFRQQIGSMQIMASRHGTHITSRSNGFSSTSSGRLSHVSVAAD